MNYELLPRTQLHLFHFGCNEHLTITSKLLHKEFLSLILMLEINYDFAHLTRCKPDNFKNG